MLRKETGPAKNRQAEHADRSTSRVCQWEKSVKLLGEMWERGVRPDVTAYNSAIKACGDGGQWERAVGLLEEMSEQGIRPNADTTQLLRRAGM